MSSPNSPTVAGKSTTPAPTSPLAAKAESPAPTSPLAAKAGSPAPTFPLAAKAGSPAPEEPKFVGETAAIGHIDVDDQDQPSIEGYESCSTGLLSDTTSLASSLKRSWLMENGRRYHAYYGPDKNLMPTDETEQERLDIHHEIMLLIMGGKLYKAPVGNPHRVLDLGTGTGIWSIDFAQDHPEAEVVGLDLSPIQPSWVPPNCRFEVNDFELEWTYKKDSFDFIHARNICHSVKDWTSLLKEVMSHLKPGAWFELGELGSVICSDDNSVPDDWKPNRAWVLLKVALTKLGRITPDGPWIEKLLIDAGFVDVKVQYFKQPLMPWPKRQNLKQAGALFAMSVEESYKAYGMGTFTRLLGWTTEDATALFKEATAAHFERKSGVHAYSKYHVAYGRKPFDTPC